MINLTGMDLGGLFYQMGIFTRGIICMENGTEEGCMCLKMGRDMTETGKKVRKMRRQTRIMGIRSKINNSEYNCLKTFLSCVEIFKAD